MAQDYAVIIFKDKQRNIEADIETPLNITANEFVVAINSVYDLGIDTANIKQCYLKVENPIALLKGNRMLSDFGIHNGSIVYYTE